MPWSVRNLLTGISCTHTVQGGAGARERAVVLGDKVIYIACDRAPSTDPFAGLNVRHAYRGYVASPGGVTRPTPGSLSLRVDHRVARLTLSSRSTRCRNRTVPETCFE